MGNHISLRGFVSSEIVMNTTDSGLVIGKFRMGSNMRRLDPITNKWVDGPTNWFRVNVFKALASNTMVSIHKGDRILIVGKLKVTSYLRKDGSHATGVEIDADSIGPDLQFGTANYRRKTSARLAGPGDGEIGHDPGGWGGPQDVEEGEIPDDEPTNADQPHEGTEGGGDVDGSEGDEDLDAAAAAYDPAKAEGIQPHEHADHETGEILAEAAPF
ncbi:MULTISPECIES: single-stranded DNA-binding protein [Arthrobacter]|uniref:Single-stranded DNA-binding protein n=1 Tax=Arthrobacter psychrochitiniphilus TaxID=291045 RepID=A0A2V3DSM1_9MICC|nr:single-stranded DNA-binding protein [Arthrobacter psychrochitiniphilus]NYG17827.1 single-strand DNA-binding protein [Arthrobacter psychrochitiniphilus]PXA65134.1 hypothetical protein CVS29_10610 [Arthrobacter psychrochitiniphilus]